MSMWSAELGSMASAPRRSSLNFFPVFDPAAWTECFRGASCSVEVVVLTCCFGLSVIFILMSALPFRPGDLFRRYSELHRQFRAVPKLHSRRGYLSRSKTAANQNRFKAQLQTGLRHFAHRLSRKVRYRDVAPFVDGSSHGRRLVFCASRIGLRGLGWGQVRLGSKISWSEVRERR